MALGSLLKGIEKVSEEVSANDMNSGGSNFINTCGVFPVTIEKAFMTATKNGGVQLDVHFGGENILQHRFYIVTVKKDNKGKPIKNEDGEPIRVTTCKMQGKTVSLPDFKTLKQLYFVATGEAKDLEEIETKVEDIKYKEYGKTVEVEGETLVDLIGKEVNIAVRLEEEYAWDKEAGETDKTQLKVNGNGDTIYKKSIEEVYSAEGLAAIEIIKETEPKMMESKRTFLEGDKGIKRVTLELPEEEEVEIEDDEDEIEF